jgi:hypothetical protein
MSEARIVSAIKEVTMYEHVIIATFDDGRVEKVISFYPDEIFIHPSEVVGKTKRGAVEVFLAKDREYLQSM